MWGKEMTGICSVRFPLDGRCHLANSSSEIMITGEETTNGLLSCLLEISSYSAGCHLQRTGDTMAPSFLSWANALSTSLRSSPERVATSPADTVLTLRYSGRQSHP